MGQLRKLPLSEMNGDLALGFILRSQNEYDNFKNELEILDKCLEPHEKILEFK